MISPNIAPAMNFINKSVLSEKFLAKYKNYFLTLSKLQNFDKTQNTNQSINFSGYKYRFPCSCYFL